MKCLYCNKQTKNPKYCSRSCAAIATNKQSPKRKLEGKCHECSTPISKSLKYCKSCRKIKYSQDRDNQTLGEVIYETHHPSSAYALVRSRARAKAKRLKWNKCIKCGYSLHIEIAHIKAIRLFDLSTKVGIINDTDNIMPLCRNCHWEFDHQK